LKYPYVQGSGEQKERFEEGSVMVEIPFCSHNQHQSIPTNHKYYASLERRSKVSVII
jgi:hypothetical protein